MSRSSSFPWTSSYGTNGMGSMGSCSFRDHACSGCPSRSHPQSCWLLLPLRLSSARIQYHSTPGRHRFLFHAAAIYQPVNRQSAQSPSLNFPVTAIPHQNGRAAITDVDPAAPGPCAGPPLWRCAEPTYQHQAQTAWNASHGLRYVIPRITTGGHRAPRHAQKYGDDARPPAARPYAMVLPFEFRPGSRPFGMKSRWASSTSCGRFHVAGSTHSNSAGRLHVCISNSTQP
ncbi:hypothetical protein PYCCODRAFT_1432209 [Trametes coccinea BRFM310]|uniref:Uncharacterized protein n=1 Tax=Trametes coccinea (strain BRFM310) TaxID=1353009 RepID=A0A1Y2IWZ7_TRAC3|nr:hypothetical protein PYCCODRAFT_1432209 [Trametes coccinea BRFM310]